MAQALTPSLDGEETSVPDGLDLGYEAYRRRYCASEWQAALEGYKLQSIFVSPWTVERYTNCKRHAYFVRSSKTGEVRVRSNRCNLRWCPLCAPSKSVHVADSTQHWIKTHAPAKFMTLTLRHCPIPLHQQIADLYEGFRKLRKTPLFKRAVAGGIWFFQVTRPKSTDSWHPHIHCIIQSRFIPQKKLSQEWLRITGTSKIVDIRQIKDRHTAASYVARYSARPAKLAGLSPQTTAEVIAALHGKRICGTWGTARSVQLHKPPPQDTQQWNHIGSWWVVTRLYSANDQARLIFDSWRQRVPLPANVSLLEIERQLDGYDNTSAGGTSYLQLTFQFWRKIG